MNTEFTIEVDDKLEGDDKGLHPKLQGVVFGDEIRNPFDAQYDYINF